MFCVQLVLCQEDKRLMLELFLTLALFAFGALHYKSMASRLASPRRSSRSIVRALELLAFAATECGEESSVRVLQRRRQRRRRLAITSIRGLAILRMPPPLGMFVCVSNTNGDRLS